MAEPQARRMFAQLLDGLAYCHAQGVYHRDLRVEHILLSGRCLQLVRLLASCVEVTGEIPVGSTVLPATLRDAHINKLCRPGKMVVWHRRAHYSGLTRDAAANGMFTLHILTLTVFDTLLCSVYEPVVKISGFGYSKSAVVDSMAKTM